MTAYLVECPSCSTRIPVDSDTMRVVRASSDGFDDDGRCLIHEHCSLPTLPVEIHGPRPVTVDDWPVTHLGRPDPAGDADWTEPEPAA